MGFVERFKKWQVPAGKVGIVWLAQAGFMFKLPNGKVIMLDPYLTDYTHKAIPKDAYIRISSPLFDPEDIKADYLFISHEHQDHADMDAYPILAKDCKVFGNPETLEKLNEMKIDPCDYKLIAEGDELNEDGFKVYVVRADHGPGVKHALGFVFDFAGTKVYYSGDTAYSPELLKKPLELQPEIALLPINGAYGNLNAVEAAVYARELKSKVCIPHHYWTFPDHVAELGEPMSALKYFPLIVPDCELKLVTPGQLIEY